jgi:hypothetical protein
MNGPSRSVLALPDEGEAIGNRDQLIAGFDAINPKSALEQAPNGWNKGRSSGQEDPVDGRGCDAARGECVLQGRFNLRQIRSDPGLEISAFDVDRAILAERREDEFGALAR